MEDLATSEISVFQIKQWLNSDVPLDNFGHRDFNEDMFLKLLDIEYQ